MLSAGDEVPGVWRTWWLGDGVRSMALDEVGEAMTPAYAIRITDAFEPTLHTRAHDGVNLR